ncbi:MAG TPA: Rieske 2Fe-2S domain-containing protein [Stellaceae bacterium]|nr:Rieske 2Fe-2S domain-containing protein [Stellaceae bacterium]
MATPIDYEALTGGARVHGSLYRDPAVFERELEAIWNKVWVYIGHDSEVPEPGDYVRRQIGLQPVLMIRGDDHVVRVLFNRCRHRGNLVCNRDRGSAATLKCPYHGWTYSRSGALLEPSFEEGYDSNLRREDFALSAVPRVASYRGLVFASAAATGPSLDEHLGQVKEYLDLFMDVSPTGEVELNTGIQKLRYKGNWKFLPENSLEGDYHGPFIHRVAFELHSRRSGLYMSSLYENAIPDVIRALPGGHMVEDYRGATMAPPQRKPSAARQAYMAMMEARYGADKARQLTSTIPPLVYVFPNLLYIMTHIRRVQPVSVDLTHIYYQPLLLKGAPPEINEARLREHEFGFGPAGLISPDDIEIMERNQLGVRAQGNEWQFIGRGLHRDTLLPDGGASGFTMDECHLRGMWLHYGRLMNRP